MQDDTERGDGSDTSASGVARRLVRGSTIGRYVLLDRLGTGGMGVVVAAYDPELDRKLAIKLLHPELADDELGRIRLLREAQALAKLSHPNVVQVHDVGTLGDSIWIAMELVRGQTLRAWTNERMRSWQEVLAVMLAAGRGLAAAHAAGLVHRDFKPSNVMIDGEGRVRVMDFGLARRTTDPEEIKRQTASTPRVAALGKDATGAGALPGTVAYMAAEQFEGGAIDARTDQFSYCVALWELLFGERPFVADSAIALARMVAHGRARAPKRGRTVPPWLRRALERGLAPSAEQRWSSMAELLAALDRGQSRGRWRKLAIGLAGLGALAIGIAMVVRWNTQRDVAACVREGEAIAETWNDDVRGRLIARLVEGGAPHADESASRIAARLDREAREWSGVRNQACVATKIDRTWTDDTYARVAWCLAASRAQMDTLITLLMQADPTAATWGVPATLQNPSPERCADIDRLARLPTPPQDREADLVEVQSALLHGRTLQRAGRYDEGIEIVNAAILRAKELQWAPATAAAHERKGELLSDAGRAEEAAELLRSAYFDAMKCGAHDVAAAAATRLVFVVGHQLGRRDEGLQWSDHGDVAIVALGEPEGLAAASGWTSRAILLRANDHAGAVALLERALAVQEAELGPWHFQVAVTLLNLGNAHGAWNKLADAKAAYERSVAILSEAAGEQHPFYATAVTNLAKIEIELAHYDVAETALQQSLAVMESAGGDQLLLSSTLEGLAEVRMRRLAFDDAAPYFERSLEILRAQIGESRPELIYAHRALAAIELGRGRPAAALVHARRVLALRELTGDRPANIVEAHAILMRALVQSTLGEDRPVPPEKR